MQPGTQPAEAEAADALLEARALTKRYGRREALRKVSLSARRGEKVAVIGPNGAGKTTLLSILAGIQKPDEGTISHAPKEVGWVPQQAALYSKLTVRENLKLFARLEGCPDVDDAVERMLDQTRLHDRADDVANEEELHTGHSISALPCDRCNPARSPPRRRPPTRSWRRAR